MCVCVCLRMCVCVQGVAPHNHRSGGGKLTGIIARCCPSFPKIASTSRERLQSPLERSRRQLVRHGGSSRKGRRERKGEGTTAKEGRGIAGRTRKKRTHLTKEKRRTDLRSVCTCWNKGLANRRRRRWKLKRTHECARVYKNVHAQVAENIITVPFLGVSISVAEWRRARSRFLKTISFTASGMCPSISSFWIPRRRERVLYPRLERGRGRTSEIDSGDVVSTPRPGKDLRVQLVSELKSKSR